MALNTERRKLLEQLMPENMIVTRKWLTEQVALDTHAIDNLVKSEQLKLLWKGLYIRGKVQLSWQGMLYTLQAVMKTDLVAGGLSALELKGFSHYLPTSRKETIHLYGNDKLPIWANELSDTITFIRHTRNKLFFGMERQLSDRYTSTVFWKEGLDELKISCPERACLEMLSEVPDKISLEHADQLIQGMTSLSPRTLQKLLEACTNVKVKRLFLWFGSRHNYTWFSKLNTDNIDLGSGNRVIVKGGDLDKTYKITIPKNFQS
ncbi:type IV toxin-antitoxin system AbiEi family antitoxin domain-containing protein [Sphingobacterium spiritivorum]|uniref:type IV toxin-antitoxin system AbiEi family antitoxin domain-containing protein n=1 Tax=Sphingobacterium spiritivorum TaxID=258 RepID=UPI003DA638E8